MFYGMCMKCGEEWALGDERSCKCKPKINDMTRDDIVRMAKEAHKDLVTVDYPGHAGQLDPWTLRLLERFAALVVAAEREACAKLADEFFREGMDYDIGAAIRARK